MSAQSAAYGDEIPIFDRIEGVEQPFEHGYFTGQDEAEQGFLQSAMSGRLHHAWLLTGPVGVGKATFAFRLARFFVSQAQSKLAINIDDLDRCADPSGRVFRQVAAGAHPNILHLRIPFDEVTKKFKTQLTVDEVRRTVRFFGSTAADTGWRITIIDRADDLNLNAANALLKILEEPPPRTLFFLLSDQPGRLLPTIRSRCRVLDFNPLPAAKIVDVLGHVSKPTSLTLEDIQDNEDLIGGSVRKAHNFLANGGVELKQTFNQLIAHPSGQVETLYRFCDAVGARGEDERFAFFIDLIESHLAYRLKREEAIQSLVSTAEVWERVHHTLNEAEYLKIDRKQTTFTLLDELRAMT